MSEDDKPRGKPAVKAKAKIPNAQSIRSPEFTPHGISAGRGSGLNRPSALTAKEAKKRRLMMIAGIVVAALAITGGVFWWVSRPGPEIEVTGKFAAEPKVEIPKKLEPTRTLKVSTPIKGGGPVAAEGDTVYVQFATYKWSKDKDEENSRVKSTSEKVRSSYEEGQQQQGGGGPMHLVIGKSGLKDIDKSLVGKSAGSRLVMQLPPSKELTQLSPQQITDKDAILFIMDVQAVVPKSQQPQGTAQKLDDKSLPKVEDKGAGKEPKVTVPDKDAPKKLEAKTLVAGNGPALAKGDEAVVNYTGKIWKSGDKFDSSWDNKQPATFPIGLGQTIPGFDKGLTGAKVGSRVLLVLPPDEGYGKKGSPPKIKGDDTLVFVVDILAKVYK
ncbi:FKBP-type peptidyl-prolyl cis-trans isomerase [Actinomadura coerulea]|uniref:FKBP-type peptidyl-prolyl cis-trans isomerase n=1 Tax=Actinomadura coerulea TaxID=46159 RepID=UPI0034465BD7